LEDKDIITFEKEGLKFYISILLSGAGQKYGKFPFQILIFDLYNSM
jgi:hypothetical protein